MEIGKFFKFYLTSFKEKLDIYNQREQLLQEKLPLAIE